VSEEKLTFEQALAGLDEVVRRLEGGDVGLEEAVVMFEEGQALLAACRERLAVAKARIDELTASDLPAAPGADEGDAEPF
jgi:exodeoxyribonuclease VII small subunit